MELIKTDVKSMTPTEVFKPDFMAKLIDDIRDRALAHKPDLTTKKGRDAIKSNAYAVARSKTLLDNLGKDLVKGWKEKAKAVDYERSKMRSELDALKAEVSKPLEDWKAQEEEKQRKIMEQIERLMSYQYFNTDDQISSDIIKDRLDTVKKIIIDESYAEHAEMAQVEKDECIKALEIKLDSQLKHEADQSELERLRAEVAERDRLEAERKAKEEEERKAKEAEEARIKAEAEAKAKAEQEEKDRLAREEQIRKDAEEKAKREAEEIAKAKAEQVERERLQAIKDKEDAERRAEEAAQAERDKIAREKAEQEELERKREADKQHRQKIHAEILEDLSSSTGNSLAAMSIAEGILKALVDGDIRHTTVKY